MRHFPDRMLCSFGGGGEGGDGGGGYGGLGYGGEAALGEGLAGAQGTGQGSYGSAGDIGDALGAIGDGGNPGFGSASGAGFGGEGGYGGGGGNFNRPASLFLNPAFATEPWQQQYTRAGSQGPAATPAAAAANPNDPWKFKHPAFNDTVPGTAAGAPPQSPLLTMQQGPMGISSAEWNTLLGQIYGGNN